MVYVTKGTYTAKNIVQMETSILKSLDYRLGNPSGLLFLRRYSTTLGVTLPVCTFV